jgi:hypothetical protein
MSAGMVVRVCNVSYLGGGGKRMESLKPSWAVSETLSQKHKIQNKKRAGGMAHVAKYLLSLCCCTCALGSIPSSTERKRKKERKKEKEWEMSWVTRLSNWVCCESVIEKRKPGETETEHLGRELKCSILDTLHCS